MPGLMACREEYGATQAARRRAHHRLAAHDHPDRGAHRDARRARRRGALGELQHLLHPGPRRRRDRRAPASRCSRGRARRSRSTGGAPSRSCSGPTVGGPNMILDDGGDATLLVHKGVEFEKAGTVPDPETADNEEYAVVLGPARPSCRRNRRSCSTTIAADIKGVTEETTTGVHRLYQMHAGRHAAVPGDQRQRLGHQEQVRQPLRLPALAHRRHQPRDRRDDRGQGRGRLRLRRRRQGLRAVAARPGRARRSSPRSTRSARCRRRWRATRSRRSTTSSATADLFVTTTGNTRHHHRRLDGEDEAQRDRRQHRSLRHRDRHGRPHRVQGHRARATSSRRSTSGCSPTVTRSSCWPRAGC